MLKLYMYIQLLIFIIHCLSHEQRIILKKENRVFSVLASFQINGYLCAMQVRKLISPNFVDGNLSVSIKTLKIFIPFNPTIPCLGIYLKETVRNTNIYSLKTQ